MPGIVAHLVVAKLVGESLKLDSDDFLRGSILPDLLLEDKMITHHKIQGKLYLVPDVKYWINKLDLSDEKQLAYFIHLLLDFHFLEEYVPDKVRNKNAFTDKSIYKDYDILNSRLIKKFSLDKKRIKKALSELIKDIDKKELLYNLSCLDRNQEETKNLDEEEFLAFLFDISQIISKEIWEYAGKSSKLPICSRKREKWEYKKK